MAGLPLLAHTNTPAPALCVPQPSEASEGKRHGWLPLAHTDASTSTVRVLYYYVVILLPLLYYYVVILLPLLSPLQPLHVYTLYSY